MIRGHRGADELLPGRGADRASWAIWVTICSSSSIHLRLRRTATTSSSGVVGTTSALYLCGGCRIHLDGMFNDGLPGEMRQPPDVESVTIQSKVINDEVPTNYGPGHDVLEGGNGDEVLSTKRGDDKLIGGGGEDELNAGLDDDDVRAADGEPDDVDCGAGEDVASVDSFDDVKNCEIVNEVIFDRRRRR